MLISSHTIDLSPSIRKKGFQQRKVSSSNTHFKQALYRNSKVHRITLASQLRESKIQINTWNSVDLKLVTELGLPAQIPGSARFPVTCQLLQLRLGQYYALSQTISIECRLSEEEESDSWCQQTSALSLVNENDDFFSFQSGNNNLVRLQYKINGSLCNMHEEFYIHFEPNQSERDRIHSEDKSPLSLCLGPFQLFYQADDSHVQPLVMWDDNPKNAVNMYRALPLPRESHYILFQELWENGTPGKLWDSALVMNHVLNTLAELNNHYLCGRRIMDLSAGIGAIGLTIAQTSHINNIPNPPQIVMTDLEEALPLMKSNQQLNNIPESEIVSIQRLEWGCIDDVNQIMNARRPFDYILISDVLYNTKDFPALINTFRQLVERNRHTVIIMGYKPRGLKQCEEDLFFDECRSHLRLELLDLESFARIFFDRFPSADKKLAFLKDSKLLQLTGVCLYKITHKKNKFRMNHLSRNTPPPTF